MGRLEKPGITTISIPRKIGITLCPALLIVLNIFLFGPFDIYKRNIDEFVVSLVSILGVYWVPALVLCCLLTAIGVILPTTFHRGYVSVLLVLGVLIWIQGHILVWKYGLLNGQAIDWTRNSWRGWIDGGLWILVLIAGLIFYKQLHKFAGIICLILLFGQFIYLAISSANEPKVWNAKASPSYQSSPQEIFDFSAKQNIIIIILDAFQSDIFQDIITKDAEAYYKVLDGFTFFRDTLGVFPTTYMSIPAILSGRTYTNRISMPEFVGEVLNGKTISNLLYREGFEIDLALTGGLYGCGSYTNKYSLPVPYNVNEKEYRLSNAALMMDLVLFRLAPHHLKKCVSIDGIGFIQGLSGRSDYLKFRYFAHKAFLQDLIDRMSVERDKPVYKFIHLCTTHAPFVVNSDCEYSGKPLLHTRKNIINQAKCSLDHVIAFLKKLKSNGIYKSSFIIISADTGAGKQVRIKNLDRTVSSEFHRSQEAFAKLVGSALPLLLIKPPYSKGPLRVSNVQATLTDIPDTLSSVMGLKVRFGGKSLYAIAAEENRERRFYYYKWRHENWQNDYFESLEEFKVQGSVFDRASWQKGNIYFAPDISDYEVDKIR